MLGLEKGASVQDMKDAYRKMALKYNPDKSRSQQDNEKFKLIHDAYQILRTDHIRCINENLNGQKSDGRTYNKNGLGSKMPYWNEFHPNKFLKQISADLLNMQKKHIETFVNVRWKCGVTLKKW